MNEDSIDKRRHSEDSLHQTVANELVIRRNPLTKQKSFKKKVKSSKAEYTFLQYHSIIWKWVLGNYNLKRRELNILLYIYPLITFSANEFKIAQQELSSTDAGALKRLRESGWITVWSKVSKTTYYTLTNRANTLISRMHRMYMFEEQIPTSPRRNVIARKKSKSNEELMGLFKKFNKIVIDKTK